MITNLIKAEEVDYKPQDGDYVECYNGTKGTVVNVNLATYEITVKYQGRNTVLHYQNVKLYKREPTLKIGDTIYYVSKEQGKYHIPEELKETKVNSDIKNNKFTTELKSEKIHIHDLVIGSRYGSHTLFFLTKEDYEQYKFRKEAIQEVLNFFKPAWDAYIDNDKLRKVYEAIKS